MSKLPLRFEANAGQWDQRVRFVARDHGATLFLTDEGMTISLRDVKIPPPRPGESLVDEVRAREKTLAESKSTAVTMRLVGLRPSAPVGTQQLLTKSNFFLGNDPTKWRTNVPNFAEVRAKAWMPGVDVVWHGGPSGLEYDFAIDASADADAIQLVIDGARGVSVREDGVLAIKTDVGELLQKRPRVYQDGTELRADYRLIDRHRVGFTLRGYHRGRAALIDPQLVYSTYLGGIGSATVTVGHCHVHRIRFCE